MILVLADLPAGFSLEAKRAFQRGVSQALCEAFCCTPQAPSVYLYEHRREDVCQDAWEKLSMTVYYSADNKTEAKRYRFGRLVDELCDRCFGEDRQPLFIIFKEHRNDNFCWQGQLVMFDHDYVPMYTDGTR